MDRALLGRVEKQAWFHTHPRSLPLILFSITFVITLLCVFAIERADAQRRHTELERHVSEIASGLQRRAAENIAYLRAAAALVRPGETLTQAEFTKFATHVYGTRQDRGSLGLGWAVRVPAGEIPAFEARMRADGAAGYRVRRRSDHPVAVPIVYLHPDTPVNKGALGFDMYSEPVRREAMDHASRLGEPVASGRVVLTQDAALKPQPGFLIYMPVYDDEIAGHGVKGFVYSPFRAAEFVAAASQFYGHPAVDIALYDGEKRPDRLLASQTIEGETDSTVDRQIVVGERRWILSVGQKRAQSLSSLSRATLLFGSVVALLLLVIARLITKRAAEDRQVLEWLTRQASIRTSLTRELNHRVKNTLANVLSIVALTRRRYTDIDEFAERLIGRVRALSATHDLLSQGEWSNAPIGEVIRSELAPYMDTADSYVELSGPEVSLAPNDALSLGMAIHELATNAAKYGALSTLEGRIHVTWRFVAPDVVEVHWREAGGPPVALPGKRGFGMELIEKIVAHELRTPVDLRFNPAGLECTLRVPVRMLADFALRSPPRG